MLQVTFHLLVTDLFPKSLREDLTKTRSDVRHGTIALHRTFEALVRRASVRIGNDEERNELRLVAAVDQALAIFVEIEVHDREVRELLVELATLGGLMEALTRLAPLRSDVDDEIPSVRRRRLARLLHDRSDVVALRRVLE